MNIIIEIINYIRALPCIIAYLSIKDKTKINMDIERYDRKANSRNLAWTLYKELPFRRIFYERIKEYSSFKYYLIRWLYPTLDGFELGTDIRNIGGGLRIYHGYATILHCNKIGENCSFFQNVTLGKGKKVNGLEVPTIGHNVCVYTGSMVLGGYTIGNNVIIGAGTLVMQDVPDNCTIVGNPARIINKTE